MEILEGSFSRLGERLSDILPECATGLNGWALVVTAALLKCRLKPFCYSHFKVL
jgi:hypothetical protein